jgi:small subunit ribosomal protein S4
MGKQKFSRKKYETPSHPWQEERIKAENELIKKYGLKNKREVWKAQTKLRKYRGQARELLAKVGGGEIYNKKESDQLLTHLNRMNILPSNSTLDDVLALETESILSRRLQTLTYLKGLASTPDQARQLISHGHIAIGDRRVTVPGYMVTNNEEGEIGYTTDSPLNDLMHPARPRAEFKSFSVERKPKPNELKQELKDKKPTEKPETTIESTKDKPLKPLKEEHKHKLVKIEKHKKESKSTQPLKDKKADKKNTEIKDKINEVKKGSD